MKFLYNSPRQSRSPLNLILAHGAGAPMDSEFMNAMAEAVCEGGIQVVRFEFPYMQLRRGNGRKRPPDRMPVLLDCFQEVVHHHGGPRRCIVAGKSMGGRVASMLLAQQQALAAVSYGYPFHPPRKPENLRNQHWRTIINPWLIVQGTRDPFGGTEEWSGFCLPESCTLLAMEDGDHDFKPRKRSGWTQAQLWQLAAQWTVKFVLDLAGDKE